MRNKIDRYKKEENYLEQGQEGITSNEQFQTKRN